MIDFLRMKKGFGLLLLLIGATFFVGCNDDDDDPIITKKNRTVLSYIIADNNLYGYLTTDIDEMAAGWSADLDGHMLVYFYPPAGDSEGYDEDPRLILIEQGSTRVLRRYERTQDPADPETLKAVIQDAMLFAPSDHFGLVLSSHGSGWIPRGMGQPLKNEVASALAQERVSNGGVGSKLEEDPFSGTQADGITGYSFGNGNYSFRTELEIDQMNTALTAFPKFDFILFDACHMACIEVAYQLKDRATYFIGSAAETWGWGFPYDQIMGDLIAADVTKVAEKFYNFYNTYPNGSYQDATVVVIENSKLPALAQQVSALVSQEIPATLTATQQYGRTLTGYQNTFFDLKDLIEKSWAGKDLTAFHSALDAAVVYKAATPSFFGIMNRNYSGLSCYIPKVDQPRSLAAYSNLYTWSTDSKMRELVPQE